MRHRRPPPVAVLMSIASAVVLAGCGIAVGEPEALNPDNRDDLLLGTTTSTTMVEDASESVTHLLYFVGPDDKLETVERPYPDSPQITDVLRELEQGPRAEEQESFEEVGLLRSVVPVGLNTTLLAETPADEAREVRVLRVQPEGELRQLLEAEPLQARLAVSQLICTFYSLTSDDEIGVEIHDEEGPMELTDASSQPIAGPAVKADFGECRTGTQELEERVEEEVDAENATETEDETTTTTVTGTGQN